MKEITISPKTVQGGEPESFPKAILLLQKLNRTEKTRLLKVINSPAFGFVEDLPDFFVEIRKKCRSDFNHSSLTLPSLRKAFSEKEKKNKNWLNYVLTDLVTAIDTTLNLEFQKENSALTSYIKAINHLNFKDPDLYVQALNELENDLKDTSAFDSLTPYLKFHLQLMRDADLEKSLQRKQHSAYQNAFTALDKFYLTQQLVLGIELSNRHNVLNKGGDIERVKDTLAQPLFSSLLADKHVYLLASLFNLFNTDNRDKGYFTAVERLWQEVEAEIKPANYMLCHYMGVLFIRCINAGQVHFRQFYLDLMVGMLNAEMFDRKGAITSASLKNLIKIAVDDGEVVLAERFFERLKIYVADDVSGIASKLIRAMIHKAKNEFSEMYLLLSEVHEKVPPYEKLAFFRMQIEAEFEEDMALKNDIRLNTTERLNAIENLQKFLKRREDEIPDDKLEAHRNFVTAIKMLRKAGNDKHSLSELKNWIATCSNLASRNWLLEQLAKK